MRTWYDTVVEILTSVGGSTATDRHLFLAKRAVIDALADMHAKYPWRHFTSLYDLATVASYATGTIAYDHTGGSSERLVTLTSGTWPSWAQYGVLLIDAKPYQVFRRLSDTTLQLEEGSNPGADVASGTSYTLFRECFTLPADFGALLQLDRLGTFDPMCVSPEYYGNAKVSQEFYGQPRMFMLQADRHLPGRMGFWFYPAPNAVENFRALYRRRPSVLTIYDTQAEGSVTAGERTVTVSGVTLTQAMVGGVLRFGTSTQYPEPVGASENQFAEEMLIQAVTSSTTAIIAENAVNSFSAGTKIRISGRIDVAPGAMEMALLAGASWLLASKLGQPTEQLRSLKFMYDDALRAAADVDGTMNATTTQGGLLQDPANYAWVSPNYVSPV